MSIFGWFLDVVDYETGIPWFVDEKESTNKLITLEKRNNEKALCSVLGGMELETCLKSMHLYFGFCLCFK
jgi:hypothetical protein